MFALKDTWRDQAACRDAAPDLFTPTLDAGRPSKGAREAALAYCQRCPVLDKCEAAKDQLLSEGFAPFGVWAGEWHTGRDRDYPVLVEAERAAILAQSLRSA